MLPFDHAVISVMDGLDSVAERYSRLGFMLTPRGHHSLGSINHTIVFDSNYLELLGYAPGERERRAEMWNYPRGLTGWCMRTPDAASLYAGMQSSGFKLEALKDISRPVTIDGVETRLSARTFQFDREETVNGRIFFCQHFTPELVWRPDWRHHENGAIGIAGATFTAAHPERLVDLLSRVPEMTREGDRVSATDGVVVQAMTPEDASRAFAGDGDLPELGDGPMRMVALDIQCLSLDRVSAVLAGNNMPHHRQERHISLGPDVACGVILRFVGPT